MLGQLIQELPRLLVFNNQQILDNRLQGMVAVNRESSKQEPLANNIQSQATTQYMAALAGASAANRAEFQTKSQASRTAIINAYDNAWQQFRFQAFQVIINRSPTDQSLAAVYTQLESNCRTLQEALDEALRIARTINSDLINDAAALLSTTKRYQAQCFQTLQLFLNARLFDIALAQVEPVMANALTNSNVLQRNALAFHAVSVRYQTNIGSSATKQGDLAQVDTALSSFTTTGTVADVREALSTIRAAAQLWVNDLANRPDKIGSGFREAVNSNANEYCGNVETTITQSQADNNAKFIQAVRTISEVIGKPSPVPAVPATPRPQP